MRFKNKFLLVFWGFSVLFFADDTYSATTPFSQYGMIQNVQNYSGNPFFNSGDTTITSPKIVYASGPALKPADCQRVLRTLIARECANHNNCKNTNLGDIRPNVMVSLSLLPNYNYASSCSGYIDAIYDEYTTSNRTANTTAISPQAAFPTVSGGNAATTSGSKLLSPVKKISPQQAEYQKRAQELENLHNETDTMGNPISSTEFPTTFQDLSFEKRWDTQAQGYEPYKDAQVYIPLNVKIEESLYKTSVQALAEYQDTIYTCIAGYGKAEHDAENELAYFEEMVIWANDVKDNVTNSNTLDPNDKEIHEEAVAFLEDVNNKRTEYKQKVENATKDAKNSPCICTENNRFRDNILSRLNVKCNGTTNTTGN